MKKFYLVLLTVLLAVVGGSAWAALKDALQRTQEAPSGQYIYFVDIKGYGAPKIYFASGSDVEFTQLPASEIYYAEVPNGFNYEETTTYFKAKKENGGYTDFGMKIAAGNLYSYDDGNPYKISDSYAENVVYVDVNGSGVETPYIHYWIPNNVVNGLVAMSPVEGKDGIFKFIIPSIFTKVLFTKDNSYSTEFFNPDKNGTEIVNNNLYKLADGSIVTNYDPNNEESTYPETLYIRIKNNNNYGYDDDHKFTNMGEGVYVIENPSFTIDSEFKVADASWTQYVKWGSNGENIKPNKGYLCYNNDDTGNIGVDSEISNITKITITLDADWKTSRKQNATLLIEAEEPAQDADWYLTAMSGADWQLPFESDGNGVYTLTPDADFVITTDIEFAVTNKNKTEKFGNDDVLKANEERSVFNNNGKNINAEKNIKNITSITFTNIKTEEWGKSADLTIYGTAFENGGGNDEFDASKWPTLYLRGGDAASNAGWNTCDDDNKFQMRAGENGTCVYYLTDAQIASALAGGLTGQFKVGCAENEGVYWLYAYGKDYDTDESYATTPDVVRVNVPKVCQNTGYMSGLTSGGVGWNLKLNDQNATITSITFTLDPDFKSGVLLISGTSENHVGDWYLLNGQNWTPVSKNEMTLQTEQDGKKIYMLDVDNFSGTFGFCKQHDTNNIYYTADGTMTVSTSEEVTTTGTQITLKNIQGANIANRNVRFFIIEEGNHVEALAMLRDITLGAKLNGTTVIDPTDKNNILVPRYDGTYRLTVPSIDKNAKVVVYYPNRMYNCADKANPQLINKEYVLAALSNQGADYVIADEFEGNVTFIWDESQPALKVMGTHSGNAVELYGNFNGKKDSWWNYENSNPDKLRLTQVKNGGSYFENIYGGVITVTEPNKEFDLYINGKVYGPKSKNTVKVNNLNYNFDLPYTEGGKDEDGSYNYHCEDDMKWVLTEAGTFYVEADLDNSSIIIYKGAENLGLAGCWNNGTEVVRSWENNAQDFKLVGANGIYLVYATDVVFTENSVNEGNRFLVIKDNDKDQRYEHPTTGNYPLLPGDVASIKKFGNGQGLNPNCYFMAEGKYRILLDVDRNDENSNPTRVRIEGNVNYPDKWYLFGDIYNNEGVITNGKPYEQHCIALTEVPYAGQEDSELPEGATGYYVAHKVRFTSHTQWHSLDSHSTHGVFGITSKPLSNDVAEEANGGHYGKLGTRLGAMVDGEVKICNGNESHETHPASYFRNSEVSWNYETNDFNGITWTETTLMGVNASCFHAPDVYNEAQSAKRYDNGAYAPGEYDVVFDLNRHRVALSNEAIETSVEAIEALWGENLVNVYTMQGTLVRAKVMEKDAVKGLPAGIYIVGKKKVMVTE